MVNYDVMKYVKKFPLFAQYVDFNSTHMQRAFASNKLKDEETKCILEVC